MTLMQRVVSFLTGREAREAGEQLRRALVESKVLDEMARADIASEQDEFNRRLLNVEASVLARCRNCHHEGGR